MYKHTQTGWFVIAPLCAALVPLGLAYALTADPVVSRVVPAAFVLLGLGLLLFYSLTVVVDEQYIRVKFGLGVIYRNIALEDVQSSEVVRNKWWYGWGIRLTPQGWMFNVSGLDAVQLNLKSGKKFRVGTDEPSALAEHINSRIGGTA